MRANLNIVLTSIATAIALAVLGNGWELNKSIIKGQVNQDATTKMLSGMVPRPEFDERLKSIEAQVTEVKARQTAFELELIKLRERK